MATELPPDFSEFLRLLNEHLVDYMVIGGYAVGYHGYPRATADLDVWVRHRRENVERLAATLRAFGLADATAATFEDPRSILRIGVPPVRLEVMAVISGVEFDDAFPDRVERTVDGVRVPFISLRWLRQNKAASGRHKDLDDLENLPEDPSD